MRRGGGLVRGEMLIFNFGRYEGRSFEGGACFRGGSNSRLTVTVRILFQSVIFKTLK